MITASSPPDATNQTFPEESLKISCTANSVCVHTHEAPVHPLCNYPQAANRSSYLSCTTMSRSHRFQYVFRVVNSAIVSHSATTPKRCQTTMPFPGSFSSNLTMRTQLSPFVALSHELVESVHATTATAPRLPYRNNIAVKPLPLLMSLPSSAQI